MERSIAAFLTVLLCIAITSVHGQSETADSPEVTPEITTLEHVESVKPSTPSHTEIEDETGDQTADSGVSSNSAEKRLVKQLIASYQEAGRLGRPVSDSSQPVNVSIRFSLVKINEIDMESQELTLLGWTAMQWHDPMLSWNPAEKSNVKQIALPTSEIWTPDVVLFNAAGKPESFHDANVVVSNEGKCTWVPQYKFRSVCGNEDRNAESISCDLVFGSWAYNSNQLNLVPDSNDVDAKFYINHHDYELGLTKAETHDRTYKCCPGVFYRDVTFTLPLTRRTNPEDLHKTTDNIAAPGARAALLSVGLAFLASSRLV